MEKHECSLLEVFSDAGSTPAASTISVISILDTECLLLEAFSVCVPRETAVSSQIFFLWQAGRFFGGFWGFFEGGGAKRGGFRWPLRGAYAHSLGRNAALRNMSLSF